MLQGLVYEDDECNKADRALLVTNTNLLQRLVYESHECNFLCCFLHRQG